MAVDQKRDRGTGQWLLRIIRQVYRYLHDDDGYGSPIRELVAEKLHRPGPRVVIAHLDSVIVFDMLTRKGIGPGPDGLQHLVTCCSPLAWPTISCALGHDGLLQIPQGKSDGSTSTQPATSSHSYAAWPTSHRTYTTKLSTAASPNRAASPSSHSEI